MESKDSMNYERRRGRSRADAFLEVREEAVRKREAVDALEKSTSNHRIKIKEIKEIKEIVVMISYDQLCFSLLTSMLLRSSFFACGTNLPRQLTLPRQVGQRQAWSRSFPI